VFDCKRVWGLAAAALVEGSDDPGAGPSRSRPGSVRFAPGG
jgi:hypothetical protein